MFNPPTGNKPSLPFFFFFFSSSWVQSPSSPNIFEVPHSSGKKGTARTGEGSCKVEIWEFPDPVELDEGADRLGVRDADKTKKKRRSEAREIGISCQKWQYAVGVL